MISRSTTPQQQTAASSSSGDFNGISAYSTTTTTSTSTGMNNQLLDSNNGHASTHDVDPARKLIVIEQAILTTSDDPRILEHVNNPSITSKNSPQINVTSQVIDLFLNEQQTELYIPKEPFAKTLILLHHFRSFRPSSVIPSKSLDLINNKHFRNMNQVVLQMMVYYADARLTIRIRGNEGLHLYTVQHPYVHGCNLEFQYASMMTPPIPKVFSSSSLSSSCAVLSSSFSSSPSSIKQQQQQSQKERRRSSILLGAGGLLNHHNPQNHLHNVSIDVNDTVVPTLIDQYTSSFNGIMYYSILPALKNKIYETCVKDTLVQRVGINNGRDDIHEYFSRFNPDTTKLKLKYRINAMVQHVEVLALDETMTVIALCDMGVGQRANRDTVVQQANSHLLYRPPQASSVLTTNVDQQQLQLQQQQQDHQTVGEAQSSLIKIRNAVYRLGEEYRNVTQQLNDMLCYDRLIVPSRDKKYLFDMFFDKQLRRGEEPRLEIQYSFRQGCDHTATTRQFQDVVHDREALMLIAPLSCNAALGANQNDDYKLQCLNAGRYTPLILNDSADSTRKKIVNNALYLRETHSNNISFKIKNSLGKMYDVLQSYQYVILKYGPAKYIWVGRHNDGIKVLAHVNSNNAALTNIVRSEPYASHGRTMSEDPYSLPPSQEQLLSDMTQPSILPVTMTTSTIQPLEELSDSEGVTPMPTQQMPPIPAVDPSILSTDSDNGNGSLTLSNHSTNSSNNTQSVYSNVDSFDLNSMVPQPPPPPPPVLPSPQRQQQQPQQLPQQPPRTPKTAANEESVIVSDIPPSMERKSPLLKSSSASTSSAHLTDEVPPVISVTESQDTTASGGSGGGVRIESRFMEVLDSVSIQVYNTRITLADVLIKSDIYTIVIVSLWLFFVTTDPMLYTWISVLYLFTRSSIDLTFCIVRDTSLALAIFLAIYIARHPETIPAWIEKMRAGQIEIEKVQVARETVLGKMFDLYVWLVKKTKLRKRPDGGAFATKPDFKTGGTVLTVQKTANP